MGEEVIKHIVIVKMKDGISEQEIQKGIEKYANLVNLIPSMNSFKWGKDMSTVNMHQGFTHVFESTFESMEGVAEYVVHPDHVEFSNNFLPQLEKFVIIDYKPTNV